MNYAYARHPNKTTMFRLLPLHEYNTPVGSVVRHCWHKVRGARSWLRY